MSGFLIAFLSGAIMSVQGVFNTQVTKVTGMWVSSVWVQLSALAVSFAMWLLMGRDSVLMIGKVEPRYLLLGGALGAGITWTVIKGMEKLGPAKATLCIVVTQVAVSYLIELFGMFGADKQVLEWRKLIGIGIAVIGLVIFEL